jgi:hypothetical protein
LELDDDGTHNGFFASLPYEEDFIIVLLRIGVASLEATGLRGWNNEVAPIQRPKITPRRGWAASRNSRHSMEDTYGRVRMGRSGVAQVQSGTSTSVARTGAMALHYEVNKNNRAMAAAWRPRVNSPRIRRGFNNDVRIIDLGQANRSGLFRGTWSRSIVAFWQFLVVFWGVSRGLVFFLLDRARRRVGGSRRERKSGQEFSERDVEEEDGEEELLTTEMDAEVYQRFLRGEDISDDDDDDEGAMEGSSDEEMSDDDEDEEKYSQEREGEVVDLFTDLLQSPDVQNGSRTASSSRHHGSNGEMALAHLLHGSVVASRPLTRRVWNSLTQRDYLFGSSSSRMTDFNNNDDNLAQQSLELMSDRAFERAEERDREKGLEHICVVCMLESREIICWPCRYASFASSLNKTLLLLT